jgi:hypothetical protein
MALMYRHSYMRIKSVALVYVPQSLSGNAFAR